VIVHTGDFKIDYTPIDKEVIDLQRFASLGNQGVLLLMADSTNAERPGHTMSEKTVGEAFDGIFAEARGRIIVATFASNIHRMQQIVDASMKYGRKVAVSGRSMENIFQVARDLGYLNVPDDVIISLDDFNRYSNNQITVITTGSQGEPMSALNRIASSTHRKINVEGGDLFIISASPIPGNQKHISKVINELYRKGAEVVYEALEDVHVSGHACQEELKLIHSLVKPKFFMPVHGEYRHLIQHSLLAEKMGMNKSNIFILENGRVLEVTAETAEIKGTVPSGSVMVDGLGVGDVGSIVLRDRKHLAEDGILTIVVTIDRESFSILAGPDIVSRGFVFVKESDELITDAKDVVKNTLEQCLGSKTIEWSVINSSIRNDLGEFLYSKTKRKPIILPIIMEV
jgi:ribonuclease J